MDQPNFSHLPVMNAIEGTEETSKLCVLMAEVVFIGSKHKLQNFYL